MSARQLAATEDLIESVSCVASAADAFTNTTIEL